jgi:hypothetical protein
VYNSVRGSEDSPSICAFDFVRDERESAKLERLREAKQHIKKVIGQLPITTTRARYLDVRLKVIADLKASKYDNAESIFDSVWPHLKPTAEEESNHE